MTSTQIKTAIAFYYQDIIDAQSILESRKRITDWEARRAKSDIQLALNEIEQLRKCLDTQA